MELLRKVSEGLARRTSRRGLFGRGAEVATGTLLGVAAGTLTRPGPASADHIAGHTACAFPGPPCPCPGCKANGTCAKPCIIMTLYYASGCWVDFNVQLSQTVTCCDCDCLGQVPGFPSIRVCGCGSDHHNNATYCPDGNAG